MESIGHQIDQLGGLIDGLINPVDFFVETFTNLTQLSGSTIRCFHQARSLAVHIFGKCPDVV